MQATTASGTGSNGLDPLQTSTVTLKPLSTGDTLTIGGKAYTAAENLTAAQAAEKFVASLVGDGNSIEGWTAKVDSSNTSAIRFTSTASESVADLTVASSISADPTLVVTTQGADVDGATPAVPEVQKTTSNSMAPALSSAPNGGPTRLAKPPLSAAPETVPPPPALPQQTETKVPDPKPVQTAASAPTTGASSAATPSDKVYRVQLAAARTAEAARSEWDRLRRGNLDLLGDLGLSVTKIDLGGTKGVFYRLRAGPLSGDAQARALCKELATRKIGCLVVRPGK